MSLFAGPFIKWVGGKAKLALSISGYFPRHIETYYEPFIGGGAIFWHLALNNLPLNRRFKCAVINDWNKELTDCYRVVRDFPDDLIEALTALETTYNCNPKPTFEEWKAKDPAALDPVSRAARMILLNKTGFNGLYRTNKSGVFNVPWGKRAKTRLFDEDNLRACSTTLNQHVSILNGDFTDAVVGATDQDLVYFDPPYIPVSKSSNFTSYTGEKFGMDDQYRLAALFKDLVKAGVKVVLSNSDTPEVRAMYEGFEIHEIQAARAVNCQGDKRGPIGELVIVGRSAQSNIWQSMMGHGPGGAH